MVLHILENVHATFSAEDMLALGCLINKHDKDGNGTFAICPIYIRALKESAIGRSQALTARESNPVIYEDGTLGQRVNSPAETDPLSPLIRKTMAMLPPKPNTMDWNKKQNVSFPGVVCLHTCSRCTMLPGCMHACVRSVRMRKCSTPSSIPMCVRALPHAPSCTAGGRRKGSFHTSHCPTSSLVILSVYLRPPTSLCLYIYFPRLFICTSRVRTRNVASAVDTWKHMQLTHVQLYKSDRHHPGNSPSSPRQTFKMTGGNPSLLSSPVFLACINCDEEAREHGSS